MAGRGELGPVAERVGAERLLLLLHLRHALVDHLEALHRVVDVGGEAREGGRDPVAQRVLLVVAADRHRHHRDERAVGVLVVGVEVRAERAGAERQHHVVHGRAGGVLHRLHLGQRHRGEGEAPARGDGRVERRARRRERRRRRLEVRLRAVATPHRQRAAGGLAERPAPRGRAGGSATWRRSPSSSGCRDGTRSGTHSSAGSCSAISGVRSSSATVISLPDAPSMAAWWTFESTATLPSSRPSITHTSHSGRVRSSGIADKRPDERRQLLPRARATAARWSGCGSRGRSRGLRSTAGGAARRGPRRAGVGTVGPGGGAGRTPPSPGRGRSPPSVVGRVEDHQPGHVHVGGRRLQVQERGVETGEALHGDLRGGARALAGSIAFLVLQDEGRFSGRHGEGPGQCPGPRARRPRGPRLARRPPRPCGRRPGS